MTTPNGPFHNAAGTGAPQPPPAQAPRPSPPRQFGPNQVDYLTRQGFSSGLIRAISLSADSFPLRMWIISNSSTMQTHDGHRLAGSLDNIQMVPCTRWAELLSCVNYHVDMAGCLGLPARYTVVNNAGQDGGPKRFSVGEKGPAAAMQDIQFAKDSMARVVTSGATPITKYITAAGREIASLAPMLHRERKGVTLVLALDNLPTDDDGHEDTAGFVHALTTLERLPVTVVVRLCTDEERVVDFYNAIDAKLNLRFDVLNDFFGEALEVFLRNPWLCYGYPLHRFRELGFNFAATDELDERALTLSELRELCSILFSLGEGNTRVVLPDPATQWQQFVNALSTLMSKERLQFNPVTKRLEPWIDLNRLHANYVGQARPQQVPQGPYTNQHNQFAQASCPQQPQVQQQQQQQYQKIPQNNQQYYQHPQAQQGFHRPGYGQQPPPPTQQFSHPQQPSNHNAPHVHQPTQPPTSQPGSQGPTQPARPFQHPSQSQQQPASASAPSPNSPQLSQQPGSQTLQTNTSKVDESSIKRNILTSWALLPPNCQALRPIDQLLGTVQTTFPPAFGIEPHEYFKKWKPFSPGAFSSGEHAVLKKAMRKMKFFLHPDKLPGDLSSHQAFLCKMLWDITADSWEAEEKSKA